ncbi:MAG: DUF4012 domain-containing protein [Candidatus Woykebacteria bacterium]
MPINHVEIDQKQIKKRKLKVANRKIIIFGLVFLFLVLTLASVFYVYPKTILVSKDVSKVAGQVKVLEAAIEKQDITEAEKANQQLKEDLQKTQRDLSAIKFFRWVPLANFYYGDATSAVRAGLHLTEAGKIVTESISPFGDILGLKGAKSNLKAEDKVVVLVTKVFPKISERTKDLEQILASVQSEVSSINEARYPNWLVIKGVKIHDVISRGKESLANAQKLMPIVKNASQVLPSILGSDREKTYLLWFQNDGELRATGGFITAYGYLKVKNGGITSLRSENIIDLDRKFVPVEDPPEVYRKYFGQNFFPIRDANVSPDFKISSEKFLSFYQTIPNQPKVDGVIAVDTSLVPQFLKITGPVTIEKYGETFSAEPHPDYRISDAVYKLELYAQRVLKGSSERKGPIGDLMQEVTNRLFNAKPEKFPDIFNTVLKSMQEKSIQFYFNDQKAQKLSEELDFAGRIKDFDGDYLHVSNSNVAGLKGNFFTKFTIEQDIVVKDDGTVVKKVSNTIKNTFRYDGWLNSVYQNWLRIYVPQGSKLIEKNVETDFVEKNEIGKKVWSGFSRTPPFNSTTTFFTYELPFKVKKGGSYKMLIQKQAGYIPHMVIKINEKKLFEFDLKKDTELDFKL